MFSIMTGFMTEDSIKMSLTEADIYADLDDGNVNRVNGCKSAKKKAANNVDNKEPVYLVLVYDMHEHQTHLLLTFIQ